MKVAITKCKECGKNKRIKIHLQGTPIKNEDAERYLINRPHLTRHNCLNGEVNFFALDDILNN